MPKNMEQYKNKIYHGDCLEFMKKVPDNFFDLIFADPPYRFEPHGRGFASKRNYLNKGAKEIGVSKNFDLYSTIFLDECLRILKKPNIFLFCNKAQVFDILSFAKKQNLCFEIIVLCKTAPTPLTNNQWLPDKEYGIHIHKQQKVRGNYHTKKTFYIDTTFKDTNIAHPTPKPLKIVINLLKNLAEPNNKICDPFMGSGTTGVACKSMGLDFWGCELTKEYINTANERLSKVQKSFNFEEAT